MILNNFNPVKNKAIKRLINIFNKVYTVPPSSGIFFSLDSIVMTIKPAVNNIMILL